MKWLLDTNIISFLLRGNVEVRGRHTTAREAADNAEVRERRGGVASD